MVSAPSISEIALYPIIGVLAVRLPYIVLTLLFLSLFAIGGALYALAVGIWMALLGQGLMGAAAGFCSAVVHIYIGEMGTIMDEVREKQGKRPMKFAVYIAYSFINNGGYFMAYGNCKDCYNTCIHTAYKIIAHIYSFPVFTAIMAQFPGVNPYRWPGWFLAVQSVVTGVVVVLFFREPRSLSRMKRPCKKCSCLTGLQLSVQLKSQWKTRFLVSSCITVQFVVLKCMLYTYKCLLVFLTAWYKVLPFPGCVWLHYRTSIRHYCHSPHTCTE